MSNVINIVKRISSSVHSAIIVVKRSFCSLMIAGDGCPSVISLFKEEVGRRPANPNKQRIEH